MAKVSHFIFISLVDTEPHFCPFFFTSIVLENLLHPDSCLPGTHYGVTHGSKSQERATGTPRLNSQVYGSSFFFKNKKTNHS